MMEDLVGDFFRRELSESEKDRLGRALESSPEAADRFARLAEEAYRATGYPEPVPPGTASGGNPWVMIGLFAALALLLFLGWYCGRGSGSMPYVASQILKTASAPSSGEAVKPPISTDSGQAKPVSPIFETRQAESVVKKAPGAPPYPPGSVPVATVDGSPRKDELPGVSSLDARIAVPQGSGNAATTAGPSPGAEGDWVAPAMDPSMKSVVVPESVTLAGRKPIPRLRVTIQTEAQIVVEVFSSDGTKVKTLASSRLLAGTHLFPWDERDETGAPVPPGAYRMVVTAGDERTERTVQVGGE